MSLGMSACLRTSVSGTLSVQADVEELVETTEMELVDLSLIPAVTGP